MTPKDVTHDSKIQKIACCSLYSKPDSRKKTLLLDHISDSFNILSMKYGRGLEFVIAGDTNDLKLEPILNLSPRFHQIVQDWTRMDPPALLDPILMTISKYYQVPECLEPLDADPDKALADIINTGIRRGEYPKLYNLKYPPLSPKNIHQKYIRNPQY